VGKWGDRRLRIEVGKTGRGEKLGSEIETMNSEGVGERVHEGME